MAAARSLPWHAGEEKIQKLTRVPYEDNPNTPGLHPRAAHQMQIYPMMALGTTDPEDDNRPWTTVWGGEPPFAQPVAPGGIVGIRTTVDAVFDPVVKALVGGRADGEVVKHGVGEGAMISGLTIDLDKRSRWKLYGRMLGGALSRDESGKQGNAGEIQVVMRIEQSLGNCPKYLNRKIITPYPLFKPELVSDSPVLGDEATKLVHRADMFFISSSHADEDMDTNHRGGPPGFIRVEKPDRESSTGSVIVWPEYSGNNLYQTLGNLMSTPRAGLAIPDYETGDVLYVTGDTEVLVNQAANEVMSKTKLAVKLTVTRARLIRNGLPFRGKPIEDDTAQGRSPYNPRVRYLLSEKADEFAKDYSAVNAHESAVTAKLIKKTKLTPTIFKYRFSLSDPSVYGPWQPGQYVALDFGDEMDMGWTHMNYADPGALNDDYIRTFTVSSPPGSLGLHGEEFEVVVRNVGRVTGWMSLQRDGQAQAGVRGFGGTFNFGTSGKKAVFLAGGIGITPLLGQAGVVKNLHVRWTCPVKDIGVVAEVVKTSSSEITTGMVIYLTGIPDGLSEAEKSLVQEVSSKVKVENRRMTKDDLSSLDAEEWYLCTAPPMRKVIQSWLPDTPIVFENFDY